MDEAERAQAKTGRARAIGAAVALVAVAGVFAAVRVGKPPEPTSPVTVEEGPIAAPPDLAAEVVVTTPSTSWTKLQRAVGGTLGILPPTFAGAVVLGLGLEPVLAGEIDPTSPGFAAVAGDPAAPSWAFALRLSDPRHARAVLAARYDAREGAGLTELVTPEAGAREGAVALGLTSGGMVVVAGSRAALLALGPYVTRTVAKKPLPSSSTLAIEVPRDAVKTVLAPRAEAAWAARRQSLLLSDERARLAHGGRAPDFGDPRAIVAAVDRAIGARLGTLADMARARLVVDLLDDDVRAVVTLEPASPSGPASAWIGAMGEVDAKAVLALPAGAAVAGVVARTGDGADAGAAATTFSEMLGERLAPDDERKVQGALASLEKAGVSRVAFAASWDAPRGALVRATVREPEAAARSVRSAVELAAAAPLRDLLRLEAVRVADQESPGFGKLTVADLVPAAPARSPRTARPAHRAMEAGAPPRALPAFGVAWAAREGELLLAAATEPASALAALARPEKTLSDVPAVLRATAAHGVTRPVDAVVVAQPFLADERRAPLPPAPLVVTLGREEDRAVLRLTAAYGLLREASRF